MRHVIVIHDWTMKYDGLIVFYGKMNVIMSIVSGTASALHLK